MELYSDVDFANLIDQAAHEVQRSHSIVVTSAAKVALLERVRQHREAVLEELKEGRITPTGIRDAAVAQLTDAITVPDSTPHLQYNIKGGGGVGARSIGSDALELSMQWTCHWIPWC